WLSTPAGQRAQQYWEQQLQQVPVLRLPTDFPRPTVKAASLKGARRRRSMSAALARSPHQQAQALDGGESVLLLATFQVLLGRYTGQKDITVGCPVANRGPSDQASIGPFENTWVLRSDLEGDPSFTALLQHVQQRWHEAAEHGQMPLERLIQQLQASGDVVHSPLFQVQMLW